MKPISSISALVSAQAAPSSGIKSSRSGSAGAEQIPSGQSVREARKSSADAQLAAVKAFSEPTASVSASARPQVPQESKIEASRRLLSSRETPLSVFKVSPLSMFINNKVGSTFGGHQHPLASSFSQQLRAIGRPLPTSSRKVRDSGSLLFLFAFLGFLVYIIWDGLVVKQVDVNLIVHGHDSYGNICGRNNRPIKFVERSGQNYTNKPYTKYTLINAQLERYTVDSERLQKYGQLVYVKQTDESPGEPHSQRASRDESPAALQVEHRRISTISFASAPRAAQAPSSPHSSSAGSRLAQTWSSTNSASTNSFSYAYPPPKTSALAEVVYDDHFNDSDRYDHMLVTPRSTNPRARLPDELSASEVGSQLLYLTECVQACPADHVELIFYRCLPKNWRFSIFPNAINVTRTFIDDILTDMSQCYRELIYIFSFALVLSLALLVLLRFLASVIIWSCLLLLMMLFLTMASYSWVNYYNQVVDLNSLMPHDSHYADRLASSDKWLMGAIFLTFVAFAVVGTVIIMRRRILLVTSLFKESGRAIADMPMLLLQPLLTFAALIGIMAVWSFGLICLQSMKEPVIDINTQLVVFKAEALYKIMKWYHIFAFLWVSHFAIACQHYVIGASVSKWYFSDNRYNLHSPIGSSVSELILYYLGSVALGSFLVAIFKVVRIIMRQIQYLVQRNCMSPGNANGSPSMNSLAQMNQSQLSSSCCGSFVYVWRIFIWFFDNIVMIINRDAYVEIAIHGYSFVDGAKRAFTVLASNPLKLLAIKAVSNVLLTIAKICVVFGTVSMAVLLLEEKTGQLNYSWSPIVVSAIYAYIVAHWFLSVYEMVIDSLFICYCEDYERTKNQEVAGQITGSNFMSQILTSGQMY